MSLILAQQHLNITALNIKEEALALMTGDAKKDACQSTNHRTITLEEVIQIFNDAV